MLLKASRITNLTDARYFAAKEVDFLGFNLEEGTEGYLDPVYMKAIREWVAGPKITGEFSRSPLSHIREAAAFFGLDAVQVTADYATQLADLEGLTVILEIGENELQPDPNSRETTPGFQQLLREAAPFVFCFLFKMDTRPQHPDKFQHLQSLLPAQIDWLKNICAEYPVLLQTDVAGEFLPGLLERVKPAGLSFAGGEEERVGVKSFEEIEAIFEVLGHS